MIGKRIMTVLVFLITCVLLSPLSSASQPEKPWETRVSEARTIALHTPAMLGNFTEWEIVQETPLYDGTDVITAYCFDMRSITSGSDSPRTAYVIVNLDERAFPVALYGIDGVSAYYGQEYEKAYYFGTLYSYIEKGADIRDARTDEKLSQEGMDFFSQTAEEDSGEDYSAVRQMYLEGRTPFAPSTGTILKRQFRTFREETKTAITNIFCRVTARTEKLFTAIPETADHFPLNHALAGQRWLLRTGLRKEN